MVEESVVGLEGYSHIGEMKGWFLILVWEDIEMGSERILFMGGALQFYGSGKKVGRKVGLSSLVFRGEWKVRKVGKYFARGKDKCNSSCPGTTDSDSCKR